MSRQMKWNKIYKSQFGGGSKMKDISVYSPKKYQESGYIRVSENIYKTYDDFMKEDCYVTSLSFVQEPEFDEGVSPSDISQYPLEDILDKFYVAVSDFYERENSESDSLCYLEFQGAKIENIKSLLDIVGKHVYNKEEEGYIKLFIE